MLIFYDMAGIEGTGQEKRETATKSETIDYYNYITSVSDRNEHQIREGQSWDILELKETEADRVLQERAVRL